MEPSRAETRRDPPELHRRSKKGTLERAALYIEVLFSPVLGFESEGRLLTATNFEMGRQNVADPGFTQFGHFALEQQGESVTSLQVPAEIDRPGKYVSQIPGQPNPIARGNVFAELGVDQSVIERGFDSAFEPNLVLSPLDRSDLGGPGRRLTKHPSLFRPLGTNGHVDRMRHGVVVPEVKDLPRANPARIDTEQFHHGGEIDRPDAAPGKQLPIVSPDRSVSEATRRSTIGTMSGASADNRCHGQLPRALNAAAEIRMPSAPTTAKSRRISPSAVG